MYIHMYMYIQGQLFSHSVLWAFLGPLKIQGLLDWFVVDLGFTRAFIYSTRFECSQKKSVVKNWISSQGELLEIGWGVI